MPRYMALDYFHKAAQQEVGFYLSKSLPEPDICVPDVQKFVLPTDLWTKAKPKLFTIDIPDVLVEFQKKCDGINIYDVLPPISFPYELSMNLEQCKIVCNSKLQARTKLHDSEKYKANTDLTELFESLIFDESIFPEENTNLQFCPSSETIADMNSPTVDTSAVVEDYVEAKCSQITLQSADVPKEKENFPINVDGRKFDGVLSSPVDLDHEKFQEPESEVLIVLSSSQSVDKMITNDSEEDAINTEKIDRIQVKNTDLVKRLKVSYSPNADQEKDAEVLSKIDENGLAQELRNSELLTETSMRMINDFSSVMDHEVVVVDDCKLISEVPADMLNADEEIEGVVTNFMNSIQLHISNEYKHRLNIAETFGLQKLKRFGSSDNFAAFGSLLSARDTVKDFSSALEDEVDVVDDGKLVCEVTVDKAENDPDDIKLQSSDRNTSVSNKKVSLQKLRRIGNGDTFAIFDSRVESLSAKDTVSDFSCATKSELVVKHDHELSCEVAMDKSMTTKKSNEPIETFTNSIKLQLCNEDKCLSSVLESPGLQKLQTLGNIETKNESNETLEKFTNDIKLSDTDKCISDDADSLCVQKFKIVGKNETFVASDSHTELLSMKEETISHFFDGVEDKVDDPKLVCEELTNKLNTVKESNEVIETLTNTSKLKLCDDDKYFSTVTDSGLPKLERLSDNETFGTSSSHLESLSMKEQFVDDFSSVVKDKVVAIDDCQLSREASVDKSETDNDSNKPIDTFTSSKLQLSDADKCIPNNAGSLDVQNLHRCGNYEIVTSSESLLVEEQPIHFRSNGNNNESVPSTTSNDECDDLQLSQTIIDEIFNNPNMDFDTYDMPSDEGTHETNITSVSSAFSFEKNPEKKRSWNLMGSYLNLRNLKQAKNSEVFNMSIQSTPPHNSSSWKTELQGSSALPEVNTSVKSRHYDITLSAQYASALAIVESNARPLLNSLAHSNVISCQSSFDLLTPDITFFILNQYTKSLKDKHVDSPDETYCRILALHCLVKAFTCIKEHSMECAIVGLKMDKQVHLILNGFLNSVYDQLLILNTELTNNDILHPKLCKMIQEIQQLMNVNDALSTKKILIVIQNKWDHFHYLKAVVEEKCSVCVVFIDDSSVLQIQYLNTKVIVVRSNIEIQGFPWNEFSCVVEYESSLDSSWKKKCEEIKMIYVSFSMIITTNLDENMDSKEQRVDVESDSTRKDCDSITVIGSSSVCQNIELMVLLEQKCDIIIHERNYNCLNKSSDYVIFADIIVDEQRGIVLHSVSFLIDPEHFNCLMNDLLVLSLQFCKLWLIVYESENFSNDTSYSKFQKQYIKLLTASEAFSKVTPDFDVQVLCASDMQQVADFIVKIISTSIATHDSEVSNKVKLSTLLAESCSEQEKFLLAFPSINSVTAQYMLSIAPVSTLLQMDLQDLINICSMIPRRFLEHFHKLANRPSDIYLPSRSASLAEKVSFINDPNEPRNLYNYCAVSNPSNSKYDIMHTADSEVQHAKANAIAESNMFSMERKLIQTKQDYWESNNSDQYDFGRHGRSEDCDNKADGLARDGNGLKKFAAQSKNIFCTQQNKDSILDEIPAWSSRVSSTSNVDFPYQKSFVSPKTLDLSYPDRIMDKRLPIQSVHSPINRNYNNERYSCSRANDDYNFLHTRPDMNECLKKTFSFDCSPQLRNRDMEHPLSPNLIAFESAFDPVHSAAASSDKNSSFSFLYSNNNKLHKNSTPCLPTHAKSSFNFVQPTETEYLPRDVSRYFPSSVKNDDQLPKHNTSKRTLQNIINEYGSTSCAQILSPLQQANPRRTMDHTFKTKNISNAYAMNRTAETGRTSKIAADDNFSINFISKKTIGIAQPNPRIDNQSFRPPVSNRAIASRVVSSAPTKKRYALELLSPVAVRSLNQMDKEVSTFPDSKKRRLAFSRATDTNGQTKLVFL